MKLPALLLLSLAMKSFSFCQTPPCSPADYCPAINFHANQSDLKANFIAKCNAEEKEEKEHPDPLLIKPSPYTCEQKADYFARFIWSYEKAIAQDVPALKVTRKLDNSGCDHRKYKDPKSFDLNDYIGLPSSLICGKGYCQDRCVADDENTVTRWTCADKTRILEHDEQEPPKYWCRKVQP